MRRTRSWPAVGILCLLSACAYARTMVLTFEIRAVRETLSRVFPCLWRSPWTSIRVLGRPVRIRAAPVSFKAMGSGGSELVASTPWR